MYIKNTTNTKYNKYTLERLAAIYYVTIAMVMPPHTCEDNMLSSQVEILCFHMKAHLVFHWCLYNK